MKYVVNLMFCNLDKFVGSMFEVGEVRGGRVDKNTGGLIFRMLIGLHICIFGGEGLCKGGVLTGFYGITIVKIPVLLVCDLQELYLDLLLVHISWVQH